MSQKAASVCSKGSISYRTVSSTSQVDESLFGSAKKKAGHLHKRDMGKRASAISKKVLGEQSPDVVTISKGQLSRMMQPSPIITAAQSQALRKEVQEAKEKERAESIARKNRMLAMEEERKKQVHTDLKEI
jgi:hypothetical protein